MTNASPERAPQRQAPLPSQAKLTIGATDDPLEREADDIADRVMRMPAPNSSPLRRCPGGCAGDQTARRRALPEGRLQPTGDRPRVSEASERQIDRRRSGGVPLPVSVRSFFEPRFGVELGDVRVHAGSGDAAFARALNARAFALGSNLWFGDGQYDPWSSTGRRLLAHELVHVLQDRRAQGTLWPDGETVRRQGPGPSETNDPVQDQPASEDDDLNWAEQFLAGALLGDFHEDPTFWSTVGQIVMGFVPYAGQVADVRDLIASLKKIIFDGGWSDPWEWLNLVLVCVAFIPGLGDAIKGVGKAGIRWARKVHLIDEVLGAIDRWIVEPTVTYVLQPAVTMFKTKLREGLDAIGQRLGIGIPDEAVLRAAPRGETQMQRQIADAEAEATRRGRSATQNVRDPDLVAWLNASERNKSLSFDPAHRTWSDNSVLEAQGALAAEGAKILPGPVRRDPTGQGDMIDGVGVDWDVKTPRAGLAVQGVVTSIVAELTNTPHHVLVNATQISNSQAVEVLDEVRAALKKAGKSDLFKRVATVPDLVQLDPVGVERGVRVIVGDEHGGEE